LAHITRDEFVEVRSLSRSSWNRSDGESSPMRGCEVVRIPGVKHMAGDGSGECSKRLPGGDQFDRKIGVVSQSVTAEQYLRYRNVTVRGGRLLRIT
jgi:hypothetical protein